MRGCVERDHGASRRCMSPAMAREIPASSISSTAVSSLLRRRWRTSQKTFARPLPGAAGPGTPVGRGAPPVCRDRARPPRTAAGHQGAGSSPPATARPPWSSATHAAKRHVSPPSTQTTSRRQALGEGHKQRERATPIWRVGPSDPGGDDAAFGIPRFPPGDAACGPSPASQGHHHTALCSVILADGGPGSPR